MYSLGIAQKLAVDIISVVDSICVFATALEQPLMPLSSAIESVLRASYTQKREAWNISHDFLFEWTVHPEQRNKKSEHSQHGVDVAFTLSAWQLSSLAFVFCAFNTRKHYQQLCMFFVPTMCSPGSVLSINCSRHCTVSNGSFHRKQPATVSDRGDSFSLGKLALYFDSSNDCHSFLFSFHVQRTDFGIELELGKPFGDSCQSNFLTFCSEPAHQRQSCKFWAGLCTAIRIARSDSSRAVKTGNERQPLSRRFPWESWSIYLK